MLAAKKSPEARTAFETALAERPKSGLALYGIARAAEQAGDRGGAVKAYSDFLTSWKKADPALPQLAHARAYVSANAKE